MNDIISTEKAIDIVQEFLAEILKEEPGVPKGFGAVMICEYELSSPYTRSEIDEFEFTMEIARLKTQGKVIYGLIDTEHIMMPTKADFIKDALIMERWFNKEYGYPMFDKLQIIECVNCKLGSLRRFLIIEKGIFEFNKFKTIDTYMQNHPPIIYEKAFDFIQRKLKDESVGDQDDLLMLRACGMELRDYFNRILLNVDSRSL